MSDTVKLIIEIPKEIYMGLFNDEELTGGECAWLLSAVKNGIPLDDVKAEIDQYLFQNEFGSEYREEVSQIIDNIGKVECKHCEFCDLFNNLCLIDNSKCYENKKCLHEDCPKFKDGEWCPQ